ncbi:MAG: phosphate acyltransferase PlsX [Acidobacteria bacterium]|nr:MAG: phosphate acyltransferase PlsX [Acidobacteriota bacterium]
MSLPLAVDGMGGDHAPHEIVRGALEYARDTGNRVLVVGRPDELEAALARCGGRPSDRLEIVPASQVIEMGEKITSIRTKRDSSIHVGARLLRDGRAAGFVSAGHTGAMMAVCKVICGLLEGVDRPALPAPLPQRGGGYAILLDAGANLDCRPEHFRQFAVMGHHYARRVFGIERPRVALLSVGEEDTKGTEVLRKVQHILKATKINFIGNVEGNSIFSRRTDVVLCDGFVGNVVLKVSEGIAESIVNELRDEIARGPLRRLGALALKPVFRVLMRKLDYAEYGGVPLLGLNGVAVVAHGRSRAKAIRNALKVAETAARLEMVQKIAADIEALHEAEQRLGATA